MDTALEQSIRVVLVGPQLSCWGLERLLQSRAPQFVHAGSTDSLESLQQLVTAAPVDVVVVDLDSYFEEALLEDLLQRSGLRVVLLTSSKDHDLLDKAVIGGVRGVVRRHEPPEILLRAIEKVQLGELWIDRGATARIFMELARQKAGTSDDPAQAKIGTLTARERQMIQAVAHDTAVPGKVIAQRLSISEHTLRNHLSSIYSKLGLSNRLDLYAFATRHQLDQAGSPGTRV